MMNHFPVMLQETIDALQIKPDGIYVDLTLGRAGHAASILKKLDTGTLIAFDKDIRALEESKQTLDQISNNFKLLHLDFRYFQRELLALGINQVDGILADLGVSSPQINNKERGFSYSKDGPLDMRMNQEQALSAHNIVNSYDEQELVKIFRYFADVKLPQRVAKGIIANRPISTTQELVRVIRASLPAAIVRKKNPSKAVFQAIRIAVNDEFNALKSMVKQAISILKPNGSLAIITFHSLEDKIVKKLFGELIRDPTGKLPLVFKQKFRAQKLKPSQVEINQNNRSRSAQLRVLTRVKE